MRRISGVDSTARSVKRVALSEDRKGIWKNAP